MGILVINDSLKNYRHIAELYTTLNMRFHINQHHFSAKTVLYDAPLIGILLFFGMVLQGIKN